MGRVLGWRPRSGAVIVGLVLAVAAGGVGWAATRSAGSGVITACADPAGGQLFLSSNGSCAGGQTLVSWNQEGPQGQPGQQGPPGAAGASAGGVVAWGPSKYHGFSISSEIDTARTYVIDGSADEQLVPKTQHPFILRCRLYAGPKNGSASVIESWNQKYVFHNGVIFPGSGPLDVGHELAVAANDVPLAIYFACQSNVNVWWSHPMITIEAATTPKLNEHVAPALPFRPVIGPGPLKRVLGTL
jgi:hypothetical protein